MKKFKNYKKTKKKVRGTRQNPPALGLICKNEYQKDEPEREIRIQKEIARLKQFATLD